MATKTKDSDFLLWSAIWPSEAILFLPIQCMKMKSTLISSRYSTRSIRTKEVEWLLCSINILAISLNSMSPTKIIRTLLKICLIMYDLTVRNSINCINQELFRTLMRRARRQSNRCLRCTLHRSQSFQIKKQIQTPHWELSTLMLMWIIRITYKDTKKMMKSEKTSLMSHKAKTAMKIYNQIED